jgi:hypothetical protein
LQIGVKFNELTHPEEDLLKEVDLSVEIKKVEPKTKFVSKIGAGSKIGGGIKVP